MWDKLAENCGKYLSKGSPALVEGRLQQKSWTGKDGEKESRLEVMGSAVQFLGQAGSATEVSEIQGGRVGEVADMFGGTMAFEPAEPDPLNGDNSVPF